jgi:hypothetical protein
MKCILIEPSSTELDEGYHHRRQMCPDRSRATVSGVALPDLFAVGKPCMENVTALELTPPYLVFVGDTLDPMFAKTGFGIVDWRRELCLGQYRLSNAAVDLGLPDLTPAAAVASGAKTMVVGVANVGGFYPPTWTDALLEAAHAGLDIVAGMHSPGWSNCRGSPMRPSRPAPGSSMPGSLPRGCRSAPAGSAPDVVC